MADTRNNISSVEDKISRLQKASSNLATSISELESINSSIDGLNIDTGRWKGREQEKFEEDYSSYKDRVRNYVSRTEDAKDAIDQDIKRYEGEKAIYTTGLNNLQNTLNSLDRQINLAQKE
ncbi:YwqH-like family protein [Virgibacillus kimchii]